MEEALQWGKLNGYELKLCDKKDFVLEYGLVRHRNPQTREDRKIYIGSIAILYKNKLLVDDIVSFEGFMSVLKNFLDKRGQFDNSDNNYFEKKTKDGNASLKLLGEDRYVGPNEALQIYNLINGALIGYSKRLLYEGYCVKSIDFMSSETSKKLGNPNLKNTEVLDIFKTKDLSK